jgi:hypothetical protein
MADGELRPSAAMRLDDATLTVALRAAQWALDDIAHDLPTGRADTQRLRELAHGLETVAALLRTRSDLAS